MILYYCKNYSNKQQSHSCEKLCEYCAGYTKGYVDGYGHEDVQKKILEKIEIRKLMVRKKT